MLEKVSLFNSKKETFFFVALLLFIVSLSLLNEYYHYKQLTRFDSNLLEATVLKQYTKSKLTKKGKLKKYQVLKLKTQEGFTLYTTANMKLRNLIHRNVQIEAWVGNISFYEYMRQTYAFSKIRQVHRASSLKEKLNSLIAKEHADNTIASIYQALYTAQTLPQNLQTLFSNLGISHLIAISGFHLGVLSALLFFLIRFPYKFLQNRYFPYRSYTLDSFIIVTLFLLFYMLFLGTPPSLLRAFAMLLIGFYFYDRGIKIISMQTLLIAIVLILALFPRLIFSIGLWLSISGVFYIFLFLVHFKHLSKLWQFFLMPLWVYILMLPYSLTLFGNFSVFHPLSIIWTSLFTLFYPLSIVLHLLGLGNLLDFTLVYLLDLGSSSCAQLDVHWGFLGVQIVLSLLSVYKKEFLYLLFLYSFSLFMYAFTQVPFL